MDTKILKRYTRHLTSLLFISFKVVTVVNLVENHSATVLRKFTLGLPTLDAGPQEIFLLGGKVKCSDAWVKYLMAGVIFVGRD